MIFLLSLCIALFFALTCGDLLKKHPVPFYVGSIVISILSIIGTWTDVTLPAIIRDWLIPIIAGGGLTGALFVLVMYAGAFPNRSLGAKNFIPLRGQLSIIASIIGIGHSIAYGRSYYSMVVGGLSGLKTSTVIFIIVSTVMELIMLPLFITSFITIRKKMKGTTWKRLQKLAYPFYFLLFVHVMMLMVPPVLRGVAGYDLTVFVYGFVYISYLICRLVKATGKNALENIPKRQMIAVSVALLVSTALVAAINASGEEASEKVENQKTAEQINEETDTINQSSALEEAVLKDGTFYGEGMGNNGNIAVEVTVTDGKMSDIVITKFSDDVEYFDVDTDGKELIDRILDAQCCNVDMISGATYSSEGVLDAVEAAITQAEQ